MAVVGNAEKMWSRTAGSINAIPGNRRSVKIREAWSVALDDPNDVVQTVLAAPNLPQLCDSFPDANLIKVVSRNPTRISPIYWIVEISYEGEAGPTGESDSPINAPPEYVWSDVESDEPIDEDVNGNPIVTVNGEPIDGVTTKVADVVLQVKRNFLDFSPAIQHQYRHSVNSDTFAGFAPGIAKLTKMNARRAWQNGCGDYWEVNATIVFRYPWRTTPERAWYARVRHEGYYVRKGVTVSFSGGNGYGASGYAIIDSSGTVTNIVVTNPGVGYTTQPTVTISSTDGEGSGATASAQIAFGRVVSVNVTAGGTEYTSYVARAVDDTGEPTNKPVLLKANGELEPNSNNAIWMEWQRYTPLPYNALGLVN